MKVPPVVALFAALFLIPRIAFAAPEKIAVSRIKREPVVSSNVASIGYSRTLHALEIEFTRGAIYRFLNVPRSVYRDLIATDSKGRFIAQHIRGQFAFERVRPSRPQQPRRSHTLLAREPE